MSLAELHKAMAEEFNSLSKSGPTLKCGAHATVRPQAAEREFGSEWDEPPKPTGILMRYLQLSGTVEAEGALLFLRPPVY